MRQFANSFQYKLEEESVLRISPILLIKGLKVTWQVRRRTWPTWLHTRYTCCCYPQGTDYKYPLWTLGRLGAFLWVGVWSGLAWHSACARICLHMLHMCTEDFWPTVPFPGPKSAVMCSFFHQPWILSEHSSNTRVQSSGKLGPEYGALTSHSSFQHMSLLNRVFHTLSH